MDHSLSSSYRFIDCRSIGRVELGWLPAMRVRVTANVKPTPFPTSLYNVANGGTSVGAIERCVPKYKR